MLGLLRICRSGRVVCRVRLWVNRCCGYVRHRTIRLCGYCRSYRLEIVFHSSAAAAERFPIGNLLDIFKTDADALVLRRVVCEEGNAYICVHTAVNLRCIKDGLEV